VRRIAVTVLVCPVACIVAAGCGGHRPVPLRHEQLVARADALCAAERGVALLRDLRRLRPPAADAALVQRWLHAQQEALSAGERLRRVSGGKRLTAEVELAAAQGVAQGYALRLGVRRCAAQFPP